MRIAVLALDRVFDTGLASILDTFAFANLLGGQFRVRIVGVRKSVTTAHGLTVRPEVADLDADELLMIPALFCATGAEIDDALARPDVIRAMKLVRSHPQSGGACVASFLIAKSGVLDGGRATTSWWLGPAFRKRFPAVELDPTAMIVENAAHTTAGASMAHMDLALWRIRKHSPALASDVARYMVTDPRPSQAPYMIPDHLAHADPVVERFERWVRAHLGAPFSMPLAAKACGTSERSLQRRVREVLGKTPVAFVQDIRAELAAHLLRSGERDLQRIAAAVGYADATTVRTLLRRRSGLGVRQLKTGA